MDNNSKPVYDPKKDKLDKSRLIISIIIYIVCFFLLGAALMYLVGMVVANIKNIEFSSLNELFTKSDLSEIADNDLLNAYYITLGYDNFFAYLVTFIALIICLFKLLKEDFINIKDNKKRFIICAIIFPIAFTLIALLIDFLFSKISSDSDNQQRILSILNSDALAVTIISTVILAPVVEELIFRKVIHKLLERFHIVIFYIVSTASFALIHFISNTTTGIEVVIQIIPYLLSGLMLALIYRYSNYNIYVTILCHMLNNLIAIIMALN